jgi:hypothetical protein
LDFWLNFSKKHTKHGIWCKEIFQEKTMTFIDENRKTNFINIHYGIKMTIKDKEAKLLDEESEAAQNVFINDCTYLTRTSGYEPDKKIF